jgi:CdiI immunity protein
MKDIYLFEQMLRCYFHQDFEYQNLEEAVNDLIKGHNLINLESICEQINYVLIYTQNEENLENLLTDKCHLAVTPQTHGINLNSQTEFLEFIRDRIFKYLKSKEI